MNYPQSLTGALERLRPRDCVRLAVLGRALTPSTVGWMVAHVPGDHEPPVASLGLSPCWVSERKGFEQLQAPSCYDVRDWP